MTIAICLKVGDGVVLGTDSATSLIGEGERFFNVYSSAEKMVNLRKGLPVGMVVYGLGGLHGLSIGSLARDLRTRLSGEDPAYSDWTLDPRAYTVEEVARRVREFFYDELYLAEFPLSVTTPGPVTPDEDQGAGAPVPEFPTLGFLVAGFSARDSYPEVWEIEVLPNGRCNAPRLLLSREQAGRVTFRGMSEALNRLVLGWSPEAFERLKKSGFSPRRANDALISYADLTHPAMPIQDAIDLVRYLADVTVGFVRFKAGAPTVAPPIDVAVITRHEGFKWVARKHYFPSELNPMEHA